MPRPPSARRFRSKRIIFVAVRYVNAFDKNMHVFIQNKLYKYLFIETYVVEDVTIVPKVRNCQEENHLSTKGGFQLLRTMLWHNSAYFVSTKVGKNRLRPLFGLSLFYSVEFSCEVCKPNFTCSGRCTLLSQLDRTSPTDTA